MNNPPVKKNGSSKFAGRDWSDITVGELVSPDDVRWVELDDSVEEATKASRYMNCIITLPHKNNANIRQLLLKSPTNVVLVRDSRNSNSVISTFDYSDLNAYLLVVVGLTKPEQHQVVLFNELIAKAQQGQGIPLRTVQTMFCREATVQLDASSNLAQAIEILGSGIHRIVISDLSSRIIGVISQLRVADFFWNEGINFPSIDRLYPALLRDLNIGTHNAISVKYAPFFLLQIRLLTLSVAPIRHYQKRSRR